MTTIGGTSVQQLAKEYGTPLYVYDEDHLRMMLDTYQKAFQTSAFETGVLYASKAFSCKAMIRLVQEYGFYLDVVSAGELVTAKQAGHDCSKVFFHGNNKTPEELAFARDCGVGTIVVDNQTEAERIKEVYQDSPYKVHALLRVNPGIEAHTHKYIVTAHVDSKFGISFLNEEELVATIRVLQEADNVCFDGIHAHIGSQIFDKQAFREEIAKLFAYAGHLKETYGIEINTINLGGGFAVRYTNADAPIPIKDVCEAILSACEEENQKLNGQIKRVCIEPGRSIVAEAGYTIYTIGTLKKTPNRNYIFVDGGMADNIRPALYQAEYDAFLDGKETMKGEVEYTVAGKCCESGDILIQKITLPKAEPGDLLVMKTTGAYGYSMASHYNKLLLPAVVFSGSGKTRTVIRRETYEHLLSLEED
ncbi:MAG: diaminopimelate decarboxylase [Solobacterium sp.]|nr:diaminopimelate decarboxylase [Solobacterium sp.]